MGSEKLKACRRCGEFFPATSEYFYASCSTPDGFVYECKSCRKKDNQHSYHKNKLSRSRRTFAQLQTKNGILMKLCTNKECANPERDAEGFLPATDEHFAINRKSRTGFTPRCKYCRNARQREWCVDNKDKEKQRQLRWKRNNKEQVARRARERRAEEPEFRLLGNLRHRLNMALKGEDKSATTVELLGCQPGELKMHLQSQFREGMNWDNYGVHGWHVDHILPCAAFDLSESVQQKKCFHYSNLQPLWAKENLSKGDKVQ